MTNREKYITKRDEYDLMMAITNRLENGDICPIKLMSGLYDYGRCSEHNYICRQCILKWLNEEAEP